MAWRPFRSTGKAGSNCPVTFRNRSFGRGQPFGLLLLGLLCGGLAAFSFDRQSRIELPSTLSFVAWLVHEGRVLATLERADSVRQRALGLLGQASYDGALLLEKTRSIHTMGMKFPIDVAFCDDELRVLRIVTVPKHRITRPELKAHCVIETEAGRFAHWEIGVGDQLEIKGDLDDD